MKMLLGIGISSLMAGLIVSLGGCAQSADNQMAVESSTFEQSPEIDALLDQSVEKEPQTKETVTIASKPAAPSKPSVSTTDKEPNPALIGLYGDLTGSTNQHPTNIQINDGHVQVTSFADGSCVDPDVDRTGTWLAFSRTTENGTTDIFVKHLHEGTIRAITDNKSDEVMPAFSPDGQRIAFASNQDGNWNIFATDLNGKSEQQLTNDESANLHPTWSPDGKMLAFNKWNSENTQWEIWVLNNESKSDRKFVSQGVFPHWSPDVSNQKILFQRPKQAGSRMTSIWTANFSDGNVSNVKEIVSSSNAALINPTWSLDGTRIVFASVIGPDSSSEIRPSQSDLWMVYADGSNRTNLTHGQFANFEPVWSSNGTVYFVSNRTGSENIWAMRSFGEKAATQGSGSIATAGTETKGDNP